MTNNDPGHINNLSEDQIQALKNLWLNIAEKTRGLEDKIDLVHETEIFLAIGYDDPDVILLRWLRARKWDVNGATQQFLDTIQWRHEWGVKEFIAKGETELVEEEIRSGKSYFMGKDRAGRPINYVSVRDHIKDQFPAEATEKLTVFTMEIGRKILQPPNESVTVIFDMTDFSLKNMDYQHSKFLINLLQTYYPESFSLGIILNAPWIFNGCWYIIKPWLDPVVQDKIRFINNFDNLTEFIDPDVLPKRLNGNHPDFDYIPPTEEDLAMLNAFQNDVKGRLKAEEIHRQAAQNFKNITARWAREEETEEILAERTKAIKELRDAYEQLVPYISTRTHYHRCGVVDEPIFDIVYQRIQGNNM